MMHLLISLRVIRLFSVVGAVCVIVILFGCGSSPYISDPYSELQPVPRSRVTLGPGDDIEINFTYLPRFNLSRTIQRDGEIQLPFIGTIMAQGKTPNELREELMQLYAKEMKHPDLVVISRTLVQDQVFVGGEVKEPASLNLAGQMTALQAIMRAGGFDMRSAEVKNVVVIRHKDGQRYGCALDFSDVLKGKEGRPFYLEPYDIVWVPRTRIARINQWIDQYINKIVPQTGFFYSYTSGNKTIGIDTNPYNVQ